MCLAVLWLPSTWLCLSPVQVSGDSEMCPDFFCLTDVEDECASVTSQSMCLSVRRGQCVQVDTPHFFADAENTPLGGERKMWSSSWQGWQSWTENSDPWKEEADWSPTPWRVEGEGENIWT